MKKTLRNLVIVLLVSMMISTTCFAAESPKIYVDGITIDEFAANLAQEYEGKKAAKPAGTYTYSVFTTDNTVVLVVTDASDGISATAITSTVFDPNNDIATMSVTSVSNGIYYTNSKNYPMNIELK